MSAKMPDEPAEPDQENAGGNAKIITPLADRLPVLLPAESVFLSEMIAGRSAPEAYRKAYPDRCEGKSSTDISNAASRKRLSHKIQLWWGASIEAGMLRSVTNREEHSSELARIRERAIATSQLAAAATAEIWRGKVAGIYEVGAHERARDRLADTGFFDRIAVEMPELARGLAGLLPAPQAEKPVSGAESGAALAVRKRSR